MSLAEALRESLPQLTRTVLRTLGVDNGPKELPPPNGHSLQAVADVSVLGHMMVAEESEDALRIEFTINVKRANGLQDFIVTRSLADFDLIHQALKTRRRMWQMPLLPAQPNLKPPASRQPGELQRWADRKRGELQRWLASIVQHQFDFACDELAAFLGVSLVSFLGVSPMVLAPPGMDEAQYSSPGEAASGAAAAFAAAMARGSAADLKPAVADRPLLSPAGALPCVTLLKPLAPLARSAERRPSSSDAYIRALEQELHNARLAREAEEEQRHALELQLERQGAELRSLVEQIQAGHPASAPPSARLPRRQLPPTEVPASPPDQHARPVDPWRMMANSPALLRKGEEGRSGSPGAWWRVSEQAQPSPKKEMPSAPPTTAIDLCIVGAAAKDTTCCGGVEPQL